MSQNFTHTSLGNTGIRVHRLGLSASYRPRKKTIYRALDQGLNYFFLYGMDTQMITVLRDVLRRKRESYVVATGPYNLLWGHTNLRRTLEKRLRTLRTDYVDVFLFLGVTREEHFTQKLRDEFYRLREEGKVRAVGISTHNRKFAGKLADEGALDVIMIRYNAARRGAELEVFPHLKKHNPGIISFTATRWRYLTRRPPNWPKDQPIPTAGMSYRFVLSNPHVHVCMTAPSNLRQFQENLAALDQGPLSPDEMEFMRKFGDAVHHRKRWFM